MGLFRASYRPDQKPRKRSRLGFVGFLFLVYVCVKTAGDPRFHIFHFGGLHNFSHGFRSLHASPAPEILPVANAPETGTQNYRFGGAKIRGAGSFLNLGDRRTHLPGSLLSSLFPEPLIVPSCLTVPPPSLPPIGVPAGKQLLVRQDWPGFFGAPWTARLDGNLIALLHVYAPRNAALPVSPPELQIYAGYDGKQTTPSFAVPGTASFSRGSEAVLYRVFANGPVRCIDLVVKNGENSGTGHLYYWKYQHYYEADASFQIQP